MPLPENQLLAQGQYRLKQVLHQSTRHVLYLAEAVLEMRSLVICEFFPTPCVERDPIRHELQLDPLKKTLFLRGLQTFLHEAAILHTTYSPHLVRVYDFFEDLGTGFMVMACLEGESLDTTLNQHPKPLDPEQVQQIGTHIVAALAPLHRRGLFHLAIRPEHLQYTPSGICLTGWGSARSESELNQEAPRAEDPPEFNTAQPPGAWSDIFALASLLYRLLTGYPPPATDMRKLGIPFESALGEPWDMLLNSAFQLDPQQRPHDIERWWQAAFPPTRRLSVTGPVQTLNTLGMSFVRIAPGHFLMGSPPDEAKRRPDEQQHLVTLTRAFSLQTTPVTQAQWVAVMGYNPSFFQGNDACPVERVSWEDCQHFISKLNQTGQGHYRLPSEAEWEYACRAGTTTPFAIGNGSDLAADQACFNGIHPYGQAPVGVFRAQTVPVGSFPANAWGLYDMHGNVFEWCQDWYGDYPTEAVRDPVGPTSGTLKVERGGCWSDVASNCRSAFRLMFYPTFGDAVVGFRLVRND